MHTSSQFPPLLDALANSYSHTHTYTPYRLVVVVRTLPQNTQRKKKQKRNRRALRRADVLRHLRHLGARGVNLCNPTAGQLLSVVRHPSVGPRVVRARVERTCGNVHVFVRAFVCVCVCVCKCQKTLVYDRIEWFDWREEKVNSQVFALELVHKCVRACVCWFFSSESSDCKVRVQLATSGNPWRRPVFGRRSSEEAKNEKCLLSRASRKSRNRGPWLCACAKTSAAARYATGLWWLHFLETPACLV